MKRSAIEHHNLLRFTIIVKDYKRAKIDIIWYHIFLDMNIKKDLMY